METKHTATPWKLHFYDDEKELSIGIQGEKYFCEVARIPNYTSTDEANAEFIVRACNCHDGLLGACESALMELKYGAGHEAIDKLQDAIAKAKEIGQ